MCPRELAPMDPRPPDLELDFLATVFEVARTGICVVDEAGLFVRVNPAFCALVDYRPSELTGKHYVMCAPPEIAAVKDRFLAALLADSPRISREWKIQRRNGEQFDALVSFRPITRPDGHSFVVITFSDITESKRAQAQIEALNRDLEQRIAERTSELTQGIEALKTAEEALHESVRKYLRVIELTREGFWLINARNETIEINGALCQMLGYAQDEMLGRTPLEFVDDHYRHILERRLVPMPIPAQATYELVLRRKDGSRLPAAYNATAVMNAQGDREFSFAFITDITERKRLEENLQQTLSEREALLQSSLVGIAFVKERHFVWLNQTLERDMLGYADGELKGQSAQVLYPSIELYERTREEIYAILRTGEIYRTEGRVRRKDGSLVWCMVSGRAIDPAGIDAGTIWTIVDISRRKAAEAELLETLAREKELNDIKSRFVSMTSHEFRTPLAAILSSTELLTDYADRLPLEEKQELTDMIKASVKRMTHMLDDILLIGRADAGRLEFSPQSMDLRAYCAHLVEEVRTAGDHRHQMIFRYRGSNPSFTADEKLLRHILTNLLGNAAKYSPTGALIELTAVRADSGVLLEIADQGIGIPQEDVPGLFETFHRGSNVGHIQGTGLGLAIVKKAVDLHGGTISVETQLGKGTRFTVNLPEATPGVTDK